MHNEHLVLGVLIFINHNVMKLNEKMTRLYINKIMITSAFKGKVIKHLITNLRLIRISCHFSES